MDPGGWCGPDEDEVCVACEAFGNPQRAGHLRILTPRLADQDVRRWFADAEPLNINPLGEKASGRGYAARYRVGINRRCAVAQDQRLFVVESTEPGIDVEYEVEVEWHGDKSRLDRLWPILSAGANLVDAIGASRSVGFGACRVDVVDAPKTVAPLHASAGSGGADLMVVVQLDQPACLALPRRHDFSIETRSFIPGSAFRGSLASALLREGPPGMAESEPFRSLFLNADASVRFDDLYPLRRPVNLEVLEKGAGTDAEFRLPPRPFPAPLSARTCKEQPGPLLGSQRKAAHEEAHGVFDTLLLQAVLRHAARGSVAQLADPCCPRCERRSVPYTGRLLTLVDGEVPEPVRESLTRVSMNRRLGRAHDSQLYSLQVLAPGTMFVGRIRGLDRESARAVAMLRGRAIEVGTARSRGLGRARVAFVQPMNNSDPWSDAMSSVGDRFAAMQQAWGKVQKLLGAELGGGLDYRDALVFSITLIGDALLGGETQAPRLLIDVEDLGLGDLAPHTRLLAGANDYQWRRGYSDVYHQRKPQELATLAGSTFLFAVSKQDLREETLIAYLGELESSGIGRRRTEGFGEVAVCHPFHSRYTMSLM
jgi:CRISPR-associated protein Csx10